MSTLIKASRIAHLTDARYFAAKEVDFLGFNLEEGTESYLDPMYMKAIREWVQGPKIVGEFSRTPLRVVREAAAFFGLDAVQVSAQNHAEGLSELQGLEVILVIEIGEAGWLFSPSELQGFAAEVDVFLFRFTHESVSKPMLYANLDVWKSAFSLRPSLIEANLPTADWADVLQTLGAAGLSLVGGEEEAVGVKSYDEIDGIFEALDTGYHTTAR